MSILGVDFATALADEQMKIVVDSGTGRVVDIGKDALTGPAAGEYVGLSKIDARDVPIVGEILESFLYDPRRKSEWYEAAFRQAMRSGAEFTAFPVDSGRWVEVDDREDLDFAAKIAVLLDEEH